jgi:hypothetical protein
VWLSIDMRLGNTHLPATVSIRADNTVELEVGDPRVGPVYSTLMNADDLKSMIDFLQIAHGAAIPLPEEDEENSDGGN